MVIAPGEKEGGPDNRHQGADQWLFVIEGTGLAIVEGSRRKLRRGSLLLIENGERHEIRNTGRKLLTTLNIYSPPAYDQKGKPKAAGKPSSRLAAAPTAGLPTPGTRRSAQPRSTPARRSPTPS